MVKRLLLLSVLYTALAGLQACSNQSIEVYQTVPPLAPTCEPMVYEVADTLPKESKIIARASYNDTTWDTECGKVVRRELMRREACSLGANGIQLITENDPSFISTCYRAVVNYLLLPQSAIKNSSSTGLRVPSVTDDKVSRLRGIQSLRDDGVISQEEFEKLKNDVIQGK